MDCGLEPDGGADTLVSLGIDRRVRRIANDVCGQRVREEQVNHPCSDTACIVIDDGIEWCGGDWSVRNQMSVEASMWGFR